MNTTCTVREPRSEEALRSELATATFRVAKRHDFHAPLIDVELDLWDLRNAKQIAPLANRTNEAIVILCRAGV
jgi:hypothetical protein